MKDWNGTNQSVFKQLGASAHSHTEREENDYYATDPSAIDDLLEHEDFNDWIWECACGEGHLAKRLKDFGYKVIASDLIDHGYPDTKVLDFLKFDMKNQIAKIDIITNPPYKYSVEFIKKALSVIQDGCKVAMFLKITSLEGEKRYNQLYKDNPPVRIHVYVKRKACAKNGDFFGQSAVCYAWFVWEKGFKGKPILDWIY